VITDDEAQHRRHDAKPACPSAACAQSSKDGCKDLFATRGLRCTRQRARIYDALAGSKSHPTADELFWLTREADPELSLATVYNALEAFCEHGLCRRLATSVGPARYDADLSEHLHIQDETGHIHDVPPDLTQRFYDALGPELFAEIEHATGVRVERARIELLGAGAPPATSNGSA